MELVALLRQDIAEYQEIHDRFTKRDVMDHLYRLRRREIRSHARRVANGFLEGIVRRALRETITSGETAAAQPMVQGYLPGFPMPVVLTAEERPDGKVTYVRFRTAHWSDLQAHHALQFANIRRVQDQFDDFSEKLDALRPYMEMYPERSVDEALILMGEASSFNDPDWPLQ